MTARLITLFSLVFLAFGCDAGGESGDFDFSSADQGIEDEVRAPAEPKACSSEPMELMAEDAELLAPMVLGTTYSIQDGAGVPTRHFAASDTPEDGMVIFEFETECAGAWRLDAFVRDPVPGENEGDDPDTWYVQIDDEPEELWSFGCRFEGEGATWGWESIGTGECSKHPTINLREREAGSHVVSFRAAEAYAGVKWTALAALRVEVL